MSESSDSFYCQEWHRIFEPRINLEHIRHQCFAGHLQGSKFRTICWRLLLGCIEPDKTKWLKTLERSRESYDRVKNKVTLNPRILSADLDPTISNPLSLQTESPWKQYFADSELHASINQDVERTFPELEYFQSKKIRALMSQVLFVYAKEHPQIAYRQGMHEILGPLFFVLFFDQQSYAHFLEHHTLGSLPSDVRILLGALNDERYLEHDAFKMLRSRQVAFWPFSLMFSQIMQIIQPWYVSEEEQLHRNPMDADQPVEHRRPSTVVVSKLTWIEGQLLSQADPPLYEHLQKLEIAPQIYGIRWLRLLFGREFPIQDLLFLWDTIFADGAPFLLVDFIFIAMLIYIRQLLLASDYTGALQYLMRYPPAVDVHCFLALALHLRDPTKFTKPKQYALMNFSHITVAGRPHPNMERATARYKTAVGKNDEHLGHKVGVRMMSTINRVGVLFAESLKDSYDPPKYNCDRNVNRAQFRGEISAGSSPVKSKINVVENSAYLGEPVENKLALLQQQVSCLESKLIDLEQLTRFVADRLFVCADSMSKTKVKNNEKIAAELMEIGQKLSNRSSMSSKNTQIAGNSVEFGKDVMESEQKSATLSRKTPNSGPISVDNELKKINTK